jgi:hypothetical protein
VPFSGGIYSVLVDFTTDAATPPIDIGQLDLQMQDIATALTNCILRDGTGLPTAPIDFGGQDVTDMNTLTLTNALTDTATLTLATAGSKIVIERSAGGGTFVIGSDQVGGSALSLKNAGGTSTEIQLGGSSFILLTNSLARLTLTSVGAFTIPAATGGVSTFTLASDKPMTSGGYLGTALNLTNVANFGLFAGVGAPTISAAKGSLYLRSDGSSASTRLYSASDSAGTWVAVTTAS